jgi:MFS family permease
VAELSYRRRRLILWICCMSLFIVGIDVTIVNVALPSVQRSFHASVSDLQWTIDAYSLVIACLLMLSGSMASVRCCVASHPDWAGSSLFAACRQSGVQCLTR